MRFLTCITSIVFVFCSASLSFGAVWTVDDDGSADYSSIQVAINGSSDNDTIEVQPGRYYENINFYGKEVVVKGTEPNDIGVVRNTVIDGQTSGKTVTFDSGENNSSKLIGLTVENGSTGIYCYYSDPLIKKCVVRYSNNSGEAGIYGEESAPLVEDCTVEENAGYGIYKCDGQIKNCVIRENSDSGVAGCDGLIVDSDIIENSSNGLADCNGEINNCNISGNSGNGLDDCEGLIRNCIISRNTGSGIYSSYNTDTDIVNCIVTGNESYGIRVDDGSVKNCTILGNKGTGVYSRGIVDIISNIIVQNGGYGIQDTSSLEYNNVWGNDEGNYTGTPPGTTDIHQNPLFAEDGYWNENDEWIEGDYHLKSVAGRWDPNAHTWVNDDVNSPCIDAGDPTAGYALEPSPNGERINQGVYGGTEDASRSPWGVEPYCTDYPVGDVNYNCKVDFEDFAMMANHWLECNLKPQSACWE